MGLLTRMVEDRQPGAGWIEADPPSWEWPNRPGSLPGRGFLRVIYAGPALSTDEVEQLHRAAG
jgi:hypothetical protein